jgi:hypothetical protein
MKKSAITALLLMFCFLTAFSQELSKKNQKIISDFIICIKNHNKEELSRKISFPLEREYPIPAIKNRQEFLTRYNELFDDSLTQLIIHSRPGKDWSAMGWRGLMLLNGQIWLDADGKLITINYQSAAERKKKTALIAADKNRLHASIKTFSQPVCILETEKFRIRIDDMGDGHYRYASWPLKSSMSDKPDIIIENGKFIPDGSGGNHKYEFKNDGYVYDCNIIVIGEKDAPPALLTIYKSNKEILSQKANIVTEQK